MPTDPNLKDAIKQAMKEYEEAYAWPPDIHFARHRVPPSGWEYIGPDDHLQVSVFTTVATSGLTLALRTLDAKGHVHYQVENVDTSTLSTVVTSRFKMAEGWLIGAVVSNIGGGIADQACFVVMALQRTFKSGTAPHTILQQGYVTNVISVSWPPVFARGPAPSSGGGAFTLLGQTILAAPAASITFASIPQTHSDLLLTLRGRCSDALLTVGVNLNVNGDVGANYDTEFLVGTGAGAAAGGAAAVAAGKGGNLPGSTATANFAGEATIWIPGYSSTTFFKQWHDNGTRFETAGTIATYTTFQESTNWRNTAGITQIALTDSVGGNFATGTQATLYGLN